MARLEKTKVVYVTASDYKRRENAVLCSSCQLQDGTPIGSAFDFEIREVQIKETLEVDLEQMVKAEVTQAYAKIKVPCIVEHAGLVFSRYAPMSYPGGLTKPMWDTLGSRFVEETGSANQRALARAVVAYCDGMSVRTFVGETDGRISPEPRGSWSFYWDTVFIPNDPGDPERKLTYAEIVDSDLGLDYKVRHLSQSTKAMTKFLEYRHKTGRPKLW